ncbi:hypothetical protein NE237_019948 [Protea cynaroides]|uniref:DUF913 domain-containing protein n=1 Tax=Protea cynaroides TaxID=273540 RepID=A0A9Q0H852_9MAGN|nr:hypothetical protein NE237_019948 [Protea cynaroides]
MEVMKRIKAFIASFSATRLFFFFKQPTPSPPRQSLPASPVADIDLEMMSLEETRSSHYSSTPVEVVDWGKTILEFCLMTSIALLPLSFQSHLHFSSSFYVFYILILLAFASSLTGILFRMNFPTAAAVLELIAIIFVVLAFFMAMEMTINPPEKVSKKHGEDSQCSKKGKEVVPSTSNDVDNMLPLYSDALVAYHRRFLMKALLRAISLGTYAPGSTARIYGSEESLLPHCLCIIFRKAKDFGGGVFSLAATVMSDLIHKDPTCFPVLDAADLPSAFLDAIMGGILSSAEAVSCIPHCLDALCLNNNGLQTVKDRNALWCFVRIFTSRTYLRALTGDTPGSLSSGLDELLHHASSLRVPGVDMLIEILNIIVRIESRVEVHSSSTDSICSSTAVPMETDAEEKNLLSSDDGESSKMECAEHTTEPSSDGSFMNVESFLPDCISNVSRLLETILQNADTSWIFIEKKGIEAVLQLFTLPLMPLSISVGQSISIAFKNFSPQHSVALARARS